MFGKLIKYELKSIRKWYLTVNLALIAVALIIGIFLRQSASKLSDNGSLAFSSGTSTITNIITGMSMLGFGFLIAVSVIGTLVIIIKRFYTNIFGREGYLTLTLPVSVHQIIFSKWLSAMILEFISFTVIIIALLCILTPITGIGQLLTILPTIGKLVASSTGILTICYFFVAFISSIIFYYLAIAIGQLFRNHRIVIAIITYALIAFLNNIVGAWVHLDSTNLFINNGHSGTINSHYLLFAMGYNIIGAIIAYLLTHYIIQTKLNIQ
ncbi:ABC transporter (permease) [Streptococcus sciuri]|uniref:ABC transporter (Permease) n=1 Tax=Streptococcus sciuri TaxID=2973939 RepID=A0ABT2F5I2_9STRE|nr:ABC transporter (permease) [Streptococcus sciuri]MCS4487672.1 ABC transporter (permease) [Streptococcus sciuri]